MNNFEKLEQLDLSFLTKDFLISFISNSISLDTMTVSPQDVENIIIGTCEKIDDRVCSLVNNYMDGFLYAVSLAKEKKDLTENDLKDIHEKIVSGFSTGGLYRNVDISIKGSNHTPPSFLKVYDRMKKFFFTINDSNNDIYYNIAFAHLQLMKIHPFLDGNGRLARIVLIYQLLKYDLKPIIIPYSDHVHYFSLLEEFKVNKNIEPFINYIKEMQK